ncbi:DUF3127 domain-containing protein [Chryseobacterium sp. DT-3]|uniref:DUF3127 domain-containing protein n=1 Tax=Chryseobacterium sp. DT-3 TaxID=3396164 RepID=UPI003F540C85
MDVETFSSGFQKQSLILEHGTQYPQYSNFEFVKDKIDLLTGFNPDEQVDVYFNLNGREWTSPQGETKYFNSINAWKIVHAESENQQQVPTSNKVPNATPQEAFSTNENPFANEDDSDDLPF